MHPVLTNIATYYVTETSLPRRHIMSIILRVFDEATSVSGQWTRIHSAATYSTPMA